MGLQLTRVVIFTLFSFMMPPNFVFAAEIPNMTKLQWQTRMKQLVNARKSATVDKLVQIITSLNEDSRRLEYLQKTCAETQNNMEICTNYQLRQMHTDEKIELYKSIHDLTLSNAKNEELAFKYYGKLHGWKNY